MIDMVKQDDEGSHVDDIFASDVYDASKPLKKEFLPWHKPRKQFVRHYQWCKQIELLLNNTTPADQTLKYLGLPGNDLLDLRYFHDQICIKRGLSLKFLGFNKCIKSGGDDQTELNISLDEVRRLKNIDASSEVIADDFCCVSNEASVAWKQTKAYGPYDVINIDLCNGFAAHKPGGVENTHYMAISRLFGLQAKRMEPWLLFLTTRTGEQDVDADVLDKFVNKYLSNLSECADFKTASNEVMGIDNDKSLQDSLKAPDGYLGVFLVGLCKWLIGLAVGQNPPSKVEVKSTIGYCVDVNSKHDDLISIALRIEPTFLPPSDPLGLSAPSENGITECVLATKAVKRLQISKRINADTVLSGNLKLYTEMCESTVQLLIAARYDCDAYQEWLAAN